MDAIYVATSTKPTCGDCHQEFRFLAFEAFCTQANTSPNRGRRSVHMIQEGHWRGNEEDSRGLFSNTASSNRYIRPLENRLSSPRTILAHIFDPIPLYSTFTLVYKANGVSYHTLSQCIRTSIQLNCRARCIASGGKSFPPHIASH
ncbi:hypothetical protein PIIN_08439 [Serendipita indica DSM 11827]|uniref:Uncharacterized protein n=1 Tax=Serendipita indica (strain DSM 11827) TaxID=1109443 RepID=G4TT40_SERID|nr:hypothetical protein PIIN_08439 [Serendipita indica DSM 11827]